MEVAHTLDIGGSQWELKDVEARNEILALKTEIEKLKTVEKWEYIVPTYGGHITARRQGNIVNVIGNDIGRENKITPDIGDLNFANLPERFRPKEACFFMIRLSGSYQTNTGGTIYPNGYINYWTYGLADKICFSVSYIVD